MDLRAFAPELFKYRFKSYVGQSSRPFYLIYNEHKRSIQQKNNNSAISEHARSEHCNMKLSITDFDLVILKKLYSPVETRLTEAMFIERYRPEMNRKEELVHW